jgi:hypothetical protein
MNRACLKSIITLGCFAITGQFSPVVAGTIISGGGVIVGTSENPWFVGKNSFSYCVQRDPTFSVSEKDLVPAIEKVIDLWSETLQKFQPKNTDSPLLDGKKKGLTLVFRRSAACSPDVDLTFLFGVINKDVKHVLGNYGSAFVSFVNRTSYSEETGWSKGFLWVAPDLGPNAIKETRTPVWNNPAVLHNVLLHEMGHVFGLQHQVQGFMGEHYPEHIVDAALEQKPQEIKEANINYIFERYGFSNSLHQCWNFSDGYGGMDYENLLADIFGVSRMTDLHSRKICLDRRNFENTLEDVLSLESLQGDPPIRKAVKKLYTLAPSNVGIRGQYHTKSADGTIRLKEHLFIELLGTSYWGIVDGKKMFHVASDNASVKFISSNQNAGYLFKLYTDLSFF